MAKKSSGKGRKRVEFTLRATPGSKVFLGGTFNSWEYKRKPMKDGGKDGVFRAICMIPPGLHEYKFHVNGGWCVDPENPNFCQNQFGTLNSVLEVQ